MPLTKPRIETFPARAVRWIASITVGLAALGAVLVAGGYRWGPERFWLLAFIEYLPYPVHLVPALAAVVCSFALGRGWRLVALGTLALVLWGVMGLELHGGTPAGAGLGVRVMTYNIKSHLAAARPDGFAQLAREIDAHAPDILLLQDAGEPSALRNLPVPPVAALAGHRQRYTVGQFMVASRYPLRDCAPGTTRSGTPSDAYVRCIVDIDGLDIDLYSVHLRTPRQGLYAARREALDGVDEWERNIDDRMAQARDLAASIRTATRPVILGGDFNASESSLVVRALLETGVRDAFSAAGFGFGYTYGHAARPGFSFLRIDHVFVSRDIGVADCDAGGREGSEHRPVIAHLLLRDGSVRAPRLAAAAAHATAGAALALTRAGDAARSAVSSSPLLTTRLPAP